MQLPTVSGGMIHGKQVISLLSSTRRSTMRRLSMLAVASLMGILALLWPNPSSASAAPRPASGQPTWTLGGFWRVDTQGRVDGSPLHGSTSGIRLAQPVVGMAATPDGRGYWLV